MYLWRAQILPRGNIKDKTRCILSKAEESESGLQVQVSLHSESKTTECLLRIDVHSYLFYYENWWVDDDSFPLLLSTMS